MPCTDKEQLRADQAAYPPFGSYLAHPLTTNCLEVELADNYPLSDELSAQLSRRLSDTWRLGVLLTLLPGRALGRNESKTRRVIREYN
jgi:hypothetical protein